MIVPDMVAWAWLVMVSCFVVITGNYLRLSRKRRRLDREWTASRAVGRIK